jgi:hypothetical protein
MSHQSAPSREVEPVTGRDIDRGNVVRLQKKYPQQLMLWQSYLPGDVDVDDYSNTVELYDAVPKYFASKKRMSELRRDGQFLTSLRREFKHRGKSYQVKITPARIEEEDGSEKEYYPSWREELVEEALKKIATDQLNGVYLNDTAGVQFTLYELRKELRSRGHSIRLDDLIKSLTICRRSNVVISAQANNDAELVMDSSIFPTLIIVKRRDWERNPKRTRCYVQFNPLVTYSINNLAYRQLDYVKFMAFKRQLSRWLHKRLSHNYVQASLTEPYRIKMTTIVRDSALVNAKEVRHKMRYIDESLEELEEKAVLLSCDKKIIKGERGRIEDITYTLVPHPAFINQVKKANRRKRYLAEAARRSGLLDEEAYTIHVSTLPAESAK